MTEPIHLTILLQPAGLKVRFVQYMDIERLMRAPAAARPHILQDIVTKLMRNQTIDVFNTLARELVPEQLVRMRCPNAAMEHVCPPCSVIYPGDFTVWSNPPLPMKMEYDEKIAAPTRALLGRGLTAHAAWQQAWDSVSAQDGVPAWDTLRRG